MSVIVLVWEMGADLGHITRLKTVADTLHNKGHSVTLVIEQPELLISLYPKGSAPRYKLVQAPVWLKKNIKLTRQPVNLSELILANGYHDTQKLAEQISLWRQLFQTLQPETIIFDYAPTAILASRDMVCKKIGLDIPFSKPPNTHPLPAYDLQQKLTQANLCASEYMLVEKVNQSLQALSITPIEFAYQLFVTDQSLLLSIPELDPFTQIRTDSLYLGAITSSNTEKKTLAWDKKSKSKRLFAYLKTSYPKLRTFLQVLNQCDIQARIFIPNAPEDILQTYANSTLHISTTAYNLTQDLDQADALICHGGHTTTLDGTLNAIPILFIPLQQEQLFTAQCSIENGLGVGLGPTADTKKITATLSHLLSTPQYKNNALNCCQKYKHLLSSNALARVVKFAEAAL